MIKTKRICIVLCKLLPSICAVNGKKNDPVHKKYLFNEGTIFVQQSAQTTQLILHPKKINMKKITLLTAPLFCIALFYSCGNTDGDAKKTADSTNTAKIDSAKSADTIATKNSHLADLKPDASFATEAADGGMLEVELGKMAEEKGMSPSIKKLGAMMVKDHSKANAELKMAAAAKHITLPDGMSDKCQKEVTDLSQKKGADFDKAYADLMVSDHKDDIDAFKKESDNGMDKELSAWAKGKIPILEHHLMMAENAKKLVDK
jgi:putative membrane protein